MFELAIPINKAAKLVGCRSTRQFKSEVKKGIRPPAAITASRPHRWAVSDLQKALNKKANQSSIESEIEDLDKMLGLI